jgi:hypothetical protein
MLIRVEGFRWRERAIKGHRQRATVLFRVSL